MEPLSDLEARVLLPPHASGLYLLHNEHLDLAEPLADYLRHRDKWEHFASDEARQRALDTDEYWELQWYPRTSVAFVVVAAPTLGDLLLLARQTARQP